MNAYVYEYFLPVCGVVIFTCLITCCRYCCYVSRVKAENATINTTPSQRESSRDRRRVPTISGRQDITESNLLSYQPPADLPRYEDFHNYDPPPEFSAVVAPFPVQDDLPPAYEEVVSRNQQPAD